MEVKSEGDNLKSHRMSLEDKMVLLGEIFFLLSQSAEHRRFTLAEVDRLIIEPVKRGFFRIYRTHKGPVGLVTWCFLNKSAADAFSAGERTVHPNELASGDELWILDFIALSGHTQRIARDLSRNVFNESQVARAVRRNTNGSVARVLTFTRPQTSHNHRT